MQARARRPLPVKSLRWRCAPERAARAQQARGGRGITLAETVGQPEALEALRLGLELYGPGYNVFVAGPPGLGKGPLVRSLLDEMTPKCDPARDRVYANNFRHPERPRLLELQRGTGREFAVATAAAAEQVAEGIRRLTEDEGYARLREDVSRRYREREREVVDAFEKRCADAGFTPGSVEMGSAREPDVFLLVGDRSIPMSDVDAAIRSGAVKPEDEARIRETHVTLLADMTATMRKARAIALERQRELEKLERSVADRIVDEVSAEVRGKFSDSCVAAHLEEARAHFVDRFPVYARALLLAAESAAGRPDAFRLAAEETLREFRVNVLLDAAAAPGCPVVVEDQPTWTNLFGQIEREADGQGGVRTDFLMIHAGSLLRADGGYIVLQARDVLGEEGVWDELKRVLRNSRLDIRVPEALMASSPIVLHPDPIPLNVKVVLIGDEPTWYALRAADPEFADIFKVKATFDGDIGLDDEALRRYDAWFRWLSTDEGRLPLEPAALALIAEEGVREAGRQGRISVRFDRISDLVREADLIARRDRAAAERARAAGRKAPSAASATTVASADAVASAANTSAAHRPARISADHIRQARAAAARRRGVEERRVREAVSDGLILVETEGERIGQVNGLAVYDFGEHRFGKVARITAAVGAGQAGVLNVERIAELSGSSHDKGVMILGGYLRQVFAIDRPLAFTASVVFEQSYGGVDGDSATCAEVFAVLSALAREPLRQDLAVTGSMNQHGDVQAVGGVTDKVEGFFDLCFERGLSGTQGVIIPRANEKDLMLREDVVAACAAGKFSIYSMDRVEQGVELLTGRRAGVGPVPGLFAVGSVYADVAARLLRLATVAAPTVAATSTPRTTRPAPPAPKAPVVPRKPVTKSPTASKPARRSKATGESVSPAKPPEKSPEKSSEKSAEKRSGGRA